MQCQIFSWDGIRRSNHSLQSSNFLIETYLLTYYNIAFILSLFLCTVIQNNFSKYVKVTCVDYMRVSYCFKSGMRSDGGCRAVALSGGSGYACLSICLFKSSHVRNCLATQYRDRIHDEWQNL